MKKISILKNTATIVHVTELPILENLSLTFGFKTGWIGNPPEIPTIGVNVTLLTGALNSGQIKMATYDSVYQIVGEGLVLEDHIYACCEQAVHAMKMFLRFDEVCRSIPQDLIGIAGKEAFEDDLVYLAKVLNATEGKRNFPK